VAGNARQPERLSFRSCQGPFLRPTAHPRAREEHIVTFTYAKDNPTTGNPRLGQIRLLINDVDAEAAVFQDEEILVFLDMAGDVVLLAAAQALDTIADNEALTSKVIRTQDLQTDGVKLADSLRKRAQSLRDQHAATLVDEDEGFFEIVGTQPCSVELGPRGLFF